MMAHEVKTQPCPECGGLMRYEKHDDVLEYQGRKRTIKTLGWWCTKCGEAILTGDPLVRHERAFLQLKAEVDGVLGPKEVAKVREGLGLSQRTAGELLGGGPRGFQKYESGKQAVSTAMSHLLRLLAKDPSRLGDLAYTADQLNEILRQDRRVLRLLQEEARLHEPRARGRVQRERALGGRSSASPRQGRQRQDAEPVGDVRGVQQEHGHRGCHRFYAS